jgi:hypothetical protein
MSKSVKDGRWFKAATPAEHDALKKYGTAEVSLRQLRTPARVQIGKYEGPGWYMLLSYAQRCPRNCCDDTVHEVVPAADVAQAAADDMRSLAQVLKDAREKSKPATREGA